MTVGLNQLPLHMLPARFVGRACALSCLLSCLCLSQRLCLLQHLQSSPGLQDPVPLRAPPQRSLSSPDMSRFKFRLTSSKPPVHPVSSRALLKQQSAVLAEELQDKADNHAVLKNTNDRHSDQERLFHQLDQKLTLHAPQHHPLSPTHSQRSPPFPASISVLSLVSKVELIRTPECSQAAPCSQEHPKANASLGTPSGCPVVDIKQHVSEDHEGSSSSDLYQPSTPIRREDSLPTRDQPEHTTAENLFAAMYEQTNVLLRNLHFERLSRRATSA